MVSPDFGKMELGLFSFPLLIMSFEHDVLGFLEGGVTHFFFSIPHIIIESYLSLREVLYERGYYVCVDFTVLIIHF